MVAIGWKMTWSEQAEVGVEEEEVWIGVAQVTRGILGLINLVECTKFFLGRTQITLSLRCLMG